MASHDIAMVATDVPLRTRPSNYPEPYATLMAGRAKRALGDAFGLRNFGVNLTRLAPGAISALFHRHARQDEFIYVIEGEPTLVTDAGEIPLRPGMCAGFPAAGIAHQLHNRTGHDALILEVGDRTEGDEATYPRDDLRAVMSPDGRWIYTRKDGSAF